jgi:hypothetical protein
MSNIQAFFLGMMVAYTPCLIVLALLAWQEQIFNLHSEDAGVLHSRPFH